LASNIVERNGNGAMLSGRSDLRRALDAVHNKSILEKLEIMLNEISKPSSVAKFSIPCNVVKTSFKMILDITTCNYEQAWS